MKDDKRISTHGIALLIFVLCALVLPCRPGLSRQRNIANGPESGVNITVAIAIEPSFLEAHDFGEGLAAVRMENGLGFINHTGKVLFLTDYEGTLGFSEGLAVIWKERKYGYINKEGVVAIPLKYGEAESFSGGLARVAELISASPYGIELRPDGFINQQGAYIIRPERIARSFSEDMAPVLVNGKWGYMNKEAKVVIEASFDSAWGFSEGLAKIEKDGKEGMINKTGKLQVYQSKQVRYISPIVQEGFIVFEWGPELPTNETKSNNGTKFGFFDEKGNIAIKAVYDKALPFSEGYAAVWIDDKAGFIDKKGKVVIAPRYDDVIYGFKNGVAAVQMNDKFGYIDKSGRLVSPLAYEWANPFSEGLAAVEIDGKWGYVRITERQ